MIAAFIVGPPLCWSLGLFNPSSYAEVPPWQVPPCGEQPSTK